MTAHEIFLLLLPNGNPWRWSHFTTFTLLPQQTPPPLAFSILSLWPWSSEGDFSGLVFVGRRRVLREPNREESTRLQISGGEKTGALGASSMAWNIFFFLGVK